MIVKKQIINNCINIYKNDCINLAKEIWNNPELSSLENYACLKTKKILKNNGFIIRHSVLKTAVIAVFGKENAKLKIGIIGEFDGLPNSVTNNPEHSCGHNLLLGGSLLAALSLAKLIKKENIDLKIIFFATPSEEIGAGKNIMYKNGEFNGLDICLSWHPAPKSSITNDIWLASQLVNISFINNNSSHSSLSENSYQDVNENMLSFLKEYKKIQLPNSSYIFKNNNQHINLTPYSNTIEISIRDFNEKKILEQKKFIKKILLTKFKNKQWEFKPLETYHIYKHNLKLLNVAKTAFLLFKNDIKWSKIDKKIASNILSKLTYSQQINNMKIINYPAHIKPGLNTSILTTNKIEYILAPTDLGIISNNIPTVQFQTMCFPAGLAMHTAYVNQIANSSIGYKGMVLAAKILIGTSLIYYES